MTVFIDLMLEIGDDEEYEEEDREFNNDKLEESDGRGM